MQIPNKYLSDNLVPLCQKRVKLGKFSPSAQIPHAKIIKFPANFLRCIGQHVSYLSEIYSESLADNRISLCTSPRKEIGRDCLKV